MAVVELPSDAPMLIDEEGFLYDLKGGAVSKRFVGGREGHREMPQIQVLGTSGFLSTVPSSYQDTSIFWQEYFEPNCNLYSTPQPQSLLF
ncbi:MAG: hypothetical protein VX910_12580 [Candidatus Latescibacterota bacterium]|nr:hypothetical protein [Candidatus Latescibacterota bacterium]